MNHQIQFTASPQSQNTPMKYLKLTIALFSLIAPGIFCAAQAQEEVNWLPESRITLALTISESTPAIDAKDETGVVIAPKEKVYSNYYMDAKGAEINEGIATIKKSRFSNLELLRGILREMRNDPVPRMKSVVGWQLVILEDLDAEYGVKFFIKRKIRGGKFQIIDVSQYIRYNEDDDNNEWISTLDEQSIYDPNTDTRTFSETDLDFGQVSMALNTDIMPHPKGQYTETNDNFFPLTGIMNLSETYDRGKDADKITSLVFSQMMGIYYQEYYRISTNESSSQEFICDGSVTGSPSNFITSEAFFQGLEAAQSQP